MRNHSIYSLLAVTALLAAAAGSLMAQVHYQGDQPNRDNSGYDSSARMTASSVVAFMFTIPKRNLVITGKALPQAAASAAPPAAQYCHFSKKSAGPGNSEQDFH